MSTGAAAAAAYAMARATKASGAIVRIDPREFRKILDKVENPLVVTAVGGIFKKKNKYLTSYKGLIFYSESVDRISTPSGTELVTADKIWIPD